MVVYLSLVLFCLTACLTEERAYSPHFQQVMRDTSGVFNGYSLGEPLALVYEQSNDNPDYDDPWGLMFRRQLRAGGVFETAFYVAPNDTLKRLKAIVVNLELKDEQAAKALFEELAGFYNDKFSTANGSYGDLAWRLGEQKVLLELRLKALGNALTLNVSELPEKQ
ncbi:MAG: hypothetical protein ACOCZ8_03510 [Bacteroidota bacterium]